LQYKIENIGGLHTSRSSRSISAAVAPAPSAAVAPPPPTAVAPPPSAAIDPAGEDDPPCVGVGVGDGFRLGLGGGGGRLVGWKACAEYGGTTLCGRGSGRAAVYSGKLSSAYEASAMQSWAQPYSGWIAKLSISVFCNRDFPKSKPARVCARACASERVHVCVRMCACVCVCALVSACARL
jgi:hypothetical protein